MNHQGCAHSWAAITAALAAAFSLAGCGGGGSGGGDAAQPADQSLSGVVIDGPIQGATVCLDLDKNGACGADEPVSGLTEAQGKYTISGLTAAQVNGAPLIAMIPATATDSGTAVKKAYSLSAPAGKGAVISPITTLVQLGIAQGLTAKDAETVVAAQTGLASTSLYTDFTASMQGDSALAAMVSSIVGTLQAGDAPVVNAATAQAGGYWVRSLKYAGSDDYVLRIYRSSDASDNDGACIYYDERSGLAGGVASPTGSLYNANLYATSAGWKNFDATSPNNAIAGNPSVSSWGLGYWYVTKHKDVDVGGEPIASVVAMAQDTSVNTESTLAGVDAGQLSGVMPAGAKVRQTTSAGTTTPVVYATSNAYLTNFATLDALIAAHPKPATPTNANTASMGGLHRSELCGAAFCPKEWLWVAFGTGKAAYYYLCDVDSATSVQSNCSAAGQGTYSLEVAADGSTPVMKFAGLPEETGIQNYTRVFVETQGHVYYGWQDKPATATQTRLNDVAFAAVAKQLGITAPTVKGASATFAYAGTWSASYVGGDKGKCATLTIDSSGTLSGLCTSTGVGGSFAVSGTVSPTGTATFTTGGSTSSGASFAGTFIGTQASGSWNWASLGGTGTWSAVKK